MIRDILLVDDDPDDVGLFEEALGTVGPLVKFHSARNGLKALEVLLAANPVVPDVIFLDINMPEMNGWRCLAELKDSSLLNRIPVYMYSTSVTKIDEQRASSLGATGVFKKPERFDELQRLLAGVIRDSDLLACNNSPIVS
jgi:CheY-like chemotaxis protein